ncbi:MAG: hypothetical protein RIQ89_1588 [Bacteroidota bacterium]|jgi:outer membrane receptor protein involved in Fe transport
MKNLLLYCAIIFTPVKAVAQSLDTTTHLLDSTKTILLQEATISFKQELIKNEIDKTVLNLADNNAVAGKNILEVLRQAPGVTVDGNEQIMMSGKTGTKILINGRSTYLEGRDLSNYLKTFDAGAIQTIEIIGNPSGKYDAAGNAGIINIILKKNTNNGLNGSINGGYTQSTHQRNNQGTILNIKRNKINLYANANFNQGIQHTINLTDRIIENTQYKQSGYEVDQWKSQLYKFGIDYQLNPKASIGLLTSWNKKQDNYPNFYLINITKNNTNEFLNTQSSYAGNTDRKNINANYTFKDSLARELTADVDFAAFNTTFINVINNLTTTANSQASQSGTQNVLSNEISIGSIRLDYKSPLTILESNATVFETGIKTSYTLNNNLLAIKQLSNEIWVNDTVRTNTFYYTEQINAGYINIKKEIKKITLQLGLRGEETVVKGKSVFANNQTTNGPNYKQLQLFPTAFANYQITENHQIGITYGRRIDRPNYQDQNPYIYQYDPYNFEYGNANLKPSFTNQIAATFNYRYAIQIKFSASRSSNLIEYITYVQGINTIKQPLNAGTRTMYNLSLSTPFTMSKKWDGYIYAEPYWSAYNIKVGERNTISTINTYGPGLNLFLNNNIDLGKNTSATISGWFNYSTVTTIYKNQPLGSLDISVTKKLMSNQLAITIQVQDVFNTQSWTQKAVFGNLNWKNYRKWESRNVSVQCKFRFGKSNIKNERNRTVGNEDEINRIRTK